MVQYYKASINVDQHGNTIFSNPGTKLTLQLTGYFHIKLYTPIFVKCDLLGLTFCNVYEKLYVSFLHGVFQYDDVH